MLTGLPISSHCNTSFCGNYHRNSWTAQIPGFISHPTTKSQAVSNEWEDPFLRNLICPKGKKLKIMTVGVPQLKGTTHTVLEQVFSVGITLFPGNIWQFLETFLTILTRGLWLVPSEARPRMLITVQSTGLPSARRYSTTPISLSESHSQSWSDSQRLPDSLAKPLTAKKKETKHKEIQAVWRKERSCSQKTQKQKQSYH